MIIARIITILSRALSSGPFLGFKFSAVWSCGNVEDYNEGRNAVLVTVSSAGHCPWMSNYNPRGGADRLTEYDVGDQDFDI